jgi:hypothetical protein
MVNTSVEKDVPGVPNVIYSSNFMVIPFLVCFSSASQGNFPVTINVALSTFSSPNTVKLKYKRGSSSNQMIPWASVTVLLLDMDAEVE